MSGYFQKCAGDLSLDIRSSQKDRGLWECQIGAYWATRAHFTAHEEPALVSLPTGAGKTALMMLLAFGLQANRVLVVSPSDAVRTQTYEKFTKLEGLVKAAVLGDGYIKPKVRRQSSRVTKSETWVHLEAYDVVVALPNNVSEDYNRKGLEDIVPPPPGFFDVVFFDEAHHIRAPSWQTLLEEFEDAKCVLLTATPFRRDRRSIPGRLVYDYPLDKAMDAGIYHPVTFSPVVARSEDQRDGALCAKAHDILEELKLRRSVKMLIRTDRIKKAMHLEILYNEKGMAVEAVHSGRTRQQNARTLERLRSGELEGVIAVGKLGEGLDIADLKIAVFHEPPKSFPFTVQLIGRVARPTDTIHSAYVIADPEQLREKGVADQVRRLYRQDQGWPNLIPELFQEFVDNIIPATRGGSRGPLIGVDPEDLAPYMSTRPYRAQEDQIDLEAEISLSEECTAYRLSLEGYPNLLGIITQRFEKPPWATRTGLETEVFDLHLYYYHKESQTLFEFSTSDAIGSQIRSQIMDSDCERLGAEELVRVMHSDQDMDYLVAGLANALGPSGALPTYKMLLGDEVQGAVNPSDARVFVRGHVLAKMTSGETRGISDRQGRVWSTRRASIHDFVTWCKRVGASLLHNKNTQTAQGLEFLGSAKRRRTFPAEPLQIIMNPKITAYRVTLQGTAAKCQLDSPRLEPVQFSGEDKRVLEVAFFPNADAEPVKLAYGIDKNQWRVLDSCSHEMIDDSRATYTRFELTDFLDQFPPYFYLRDGAVVIGGRLWRTRLTYDAFPSECVVRGLDWTQCDIKVEYEIDSDNQQRHPEDSKMSVHQWLEKKLLEETPWDVTVFKDHGSGEVADYIRIDPAQNPKEICLYHCKAAPKLTSGERKGQANVGATLGHVANALDQVLRSVVWVRSRSLFNHIAERHERKNETCFVKGEEEFVELTDEFRPAEWSYKVCLVNPGLDCWKARETESVNVLLLTCYEWLQGVGCELQIMGYAEDPDS